MASELVGVGRFELPASSSRSQATLRAASAAVWLTCGAPVRQCVLVSSLARAMVTHLVTQPPERAREGDGGQDTPRHHGVDAWPGSGRWSSVVDVLPSLVTGSCGLASEVVRTCCFSSQ